MNKYIAALAIFICFAIICGRAGAALPSHSRLATETAAAGTGVTNEGEESRAYSPGHHWGGGHHFGGGGHTHFSFHSGGHYHHYAVHYHHYYYHHYNYHAASAGVTDLAGLSVFFDVLGIFTLGAFAILGIIFGAVGTRKGNRRRLAKTGMILGIIEVALGIAAVALIIAL